MSEMDGITDTSLSVSKNERASQKLKQFIQFCIVGLLSTIIDISILNLATRKLGMYWVAGKTLSFCFSVTNGFIWNSLWTFRGMGSGARHTQYVKFVAVNIVGFGLNLVIIKTILSLLEGSIASNAHVSPLHLNIANIIAIIIVSTWNFIANRKWTFK